MRSQITHLLLVAAVTPVLFATALLPVRSETSISVSADDMAVIGSVPFPRTQGPGDLAFYGNYVAVGRGLADGDRTQNGFVLVDISRPTRPRVVSTFTCTNSGFEISIYGDLVLLSRDAPSETAACDKPDSRNGDGFSGLTLVSIADPRRPVEVKSLETNLCRAGECSTGSHTHTVLPDPENGRLIVYANSLRLDVLEVPLGRPQDAQVVSTVDAVDGCHDLQIHRPTAVALCAGAHSATLLDMADPLQPTAITTFKDPGTTHHHSAVFSGDGRTIALSDESLAVTTPVAVDSGLGTDLSEGIDSCVGGPPGRMTFYDIGPTVDAYRARRPVPPPSYQSSFQIPDQIAEMSTIPCFGHYAARIPLRSDETDVLVVGYGGAGTWVVDFSDTAHPRSIGHYLATGENPDIAASSYWYNGHVYVNHGALGPHETNRGLEVLALRPSEPALAEALSRAPRLSHLQPQTQD